MAVGDTLKKDNGCNSGNARFCGVMVNSWVHVWHDIDGYGGFNYLVWYVDISSDENTMDVGRTQCDNNVVCVGHVNAFR